MLFSVQRATKPGERWRQWNWASYDAGNALTCDEATQRATPTSSPARRVADDPLAEKGVEAGIGAQEIEVGIFGGPVFVESAVFHNFSQARQGVFSFAEKGVDASDVVENRGFLGVDGQRAARPVVTFGVLTDTREDAGAKVQSAGVVGMIFAVFFN